MAELIAMLEQHHPLAPQPVTVGVERIVRLPDRLPVGASRRLAWVGAIRKCV